MTKHERETFRNRMAKENSKPIKKELWLWLNLTVLILLGLLMLVLYAPELYRAASSLSPVSKGVSIIIGCSLFAYLISKLK